MNTLIIRPGALGDTLMALPALCEMEARTDVTFVGRNPGIRYIGHAVKHIMDMEAAGWHRLFLEKPDPLGLPVSWAEHVVAFFKDEDGRLSTNLKAYFPGTSLHLFPTHPTPGEPVHTAYYFAACLERAGLPVDPARAMALAREGRLGFSRGEPAPRNSLVFHPGSGDPGKNYAPAFWIRLLEMLRANKGLDALPKVWLLGPAEAGLVNIIEKNKGVADVGVISCPDKAQLLHLLAGALCLIGHDSGISHLAAMLGTPAIALFRKSDPVQWHPLGPRVQVMTGETSESDLIEGIKRALLNFMAAMQESRVRRRD